jgi:hypothetical protein
MKKTLITAIMTVMIALLITGCSSAPENTNQVEKAEPGKAWIYDAQYEAEFLVDSFTARDGTRVDAARDLIVPFINISSADASRINNMIKGIYSDLVDLYNWDCQEKIWWEKARYDSYEYANTVSALLVSCYGGTADAQDSYYGFCFDLSDGHQLSFDEACSLLKTDKATVLNGLDPLIRKEINKVTGNKLDERYVSATYEKLESAIASGSLQFVIDSRGKLNIAVDLMVDDFENGIFSRLIILP